MRVNDRYHKICHCNYSQTLRLCNNVYSHAICDFLKNLRCNNSLSNIRLFSSHDRDDDNNLGEYRHEVSVSHHRSDSDNKKDVSAYCSTRE